MKYGIKPIGEREYNIEKLDYDSFKKGPTHFYIPSENILFSFIRIRPKATFYLHSKLEEKLKKELKEVFDNVQ